MLTDADVDWLALMEAALAEAEAYVDAALSEVAAALQGATAAYA